MGNPFYHWQTWAIGLLVLGFTACKHEPTVQPAIPGETVPIGEGEPCDPQTVYFVNDVMPLLQGNCAFSGCHGNGSAQDGVDLSSYQAIMSSGIIDPFDLNGSDLYEVITENDPDKIMPPPPATTLSSEQIATIAAWINQGAIFNTCDAGCELEQVTFSQTIGPIISASCQGCHSGASPQGGLSLVGYDQIAAIALNGDLSGVVNHTAGYVPMPYNQPKLDDCSIAQIEAWISEGALNN